MGPFLGPFSPSSSDSTPSDDSEESDFSRGEDEGACDEPGEEEAAADTSPMEAEDLTAEVGPASRAGGQGTARPPGKLDPQVPSGSSLARPGSELPHKAASGPMETAVVKNSRNRPTLPPAEDRPKTRGANAVMSSEDEVEAGGRTQRRGRKGVTAAVETRGRRRGRSPTEGVDGEEDEEEGSRNDEGIYPVARRSQDPPKVRNLVSGRGGGNRGGKKQKVDLA